MSAQEPALPSLRSLSLRDQALAAVREAIVMGTISPGTHLAETKLAANLGISRGTLREAMRQLQQEGLAVLDGRGRLHVRQLDEQTIRDTFVVRASLESLAARIISEMPSAQKKDAIAELEAALENLKNAETKSLHDNIEADLNVHRTLCRASGNAALLHNWEQLAGVISMSIMMAGPERARRNMLAERHCVILDAVRAITPDVEGRFLNHFLSVLDDFFPDSAAG